MSLKDLFKDNNELWNKCLKLDEYTLYIYLSMILHMLTSKLKYFNVLTIHKKVKEGTKASSCSKGFTNSENK